MLIVPQVEEVRNRYDPHLYETLKRIIGSINSLGSQLNVDPRPVGEATLRPAIPHGVTVSGGSGFFNFAITPDSSYTDPIFYFAEGSTDTGFTSPTTYFLGTKPNVSIFDPGKSYYFRVYTQYLASPASDKLLYGAPTLVSSGSAAGPFQYQRDIWAGKRRYAVRINTGGTAHALGVTDSVLSVVNNPPDANTKTSYTTLQTSATINTRSYITVTNFPWRMLAKPFLRTIVRADAAGDLTNARLWFVLTDGGETNFNGTDAVTQAHIGFRFSPGAANWQASSADGVTQGVTDTGVAPSSSAYQVLDVEYDGSVAKFYINGNLVATRGANLPADSTNLRWVLMLTTLTTVIKRWNTTILFLECDNEGF